MLARRIGLLNFVPLKVRAIFVQAPDPVCERQHLWQECVARVVLDALGVTGESEPKEHNAVIESARMWFKKSPDFSEVFALSGIEPGNIRESILETIPLTRASSKTKGVPLDTLYESVKAKKHARKAAQNRQAGRARKNRTV